MIICGFSIMKNPLTLHIVMSFIAACQLLESEKCISAFPDAMISLVCDFCNTITRFSFEKHLGRGQDECNLIRL